MTSFVAKPFKAHQILYIVTLAAKSTFCKMLHPFFIGHIKKNSISN